MHRKMPQDAKEAMPKPGESQRDDTAADAAGEKSTTRSCAELVESQEVNIFFTALIIANTIVLALDRYPMSESEQV